MNLIVIIDFWYVVLYRLGIRRSEMKLHIPLVNGTTLVFEGEYEELVKVGEEYVSKYSAHIGSRPNGVQPTEVGMPLPSSPISRRWTEHTIRKMRVLLYGEQAKV